MTKKTPPTPKAKPEKRGPYTEAQEKGKRLEGHQKSRLSSLRGHSKNLESDIKEGKSKKSRLMGFEHSDYYENPKLSKKGVDYLKETKKYNDEDLDYYSKLHGPGYKKGGKVAKATPKKTPKGKPKGKK